MPDAPPTESSASTSGTPAANIVASVRVQRAIDDLRTRSPKIGACSSRRSITACIFGLRFHDWKKKYNAPKRPPKIRYHHWTKKSEIAITTSVGPGRSAPKLENTLLNAGITKIMITAVTMKPTASTATG